MCGGKLVLPPQGMQADAGDMIDLINTYKVTFLHTVPTLAWIYFKHPAAHTMTSLRLVRLGGEVLSPDLAALITGSLRELQLVNVYVSTYIPAHPPCSAMQVQQCAHSTDVDASM